MVRERCMCKSEPLQLLLVVSSSGLCRSRWGGMKGCFVFQNVKQTCFWFFSGPSVTSSGWSSCCSSMLYHITCKRNLLISLQLYLRQMSLAVGNIGSGDEFWIWLWETALCFPWGKFWFSGPTFNHWENPVSCTVNLQLNKSFNGT